MLTSLPAPTDDAIRVSEPAVSDSAAIEPLVDTALHDDIVSGALRAAPAVIGAGALLALGTAASLGQFNALAGARMWLAAALLLVTLRLAHWARARAAAPLHDPMRWTQQYMIGVAAGSLLWAALPWLRFGELDDAQRLVAMLAVVGVALLECQALRALPRVAIAQAAVMLLSGAAWLFGMPQPARLEPSAMLLVGAGRRGCRGHGQRPPAACHAPGRRAGAPARARRSRPCRAHRPARIRARQGGGRAGERGGRSHGARGAGPLGPCAERRPAHRRSGETFAWTWRARP